MFLLESLFVLCSIIKEMRPSSARGGSALGGNFPAASMREIQRASFPEIFDLAASYEVFGAIKQ